jgi:hypothetical protein
MTHPRRPQSGRRPGDLSGRFGLRIVPRPTVAWVGLEAEAGAALANRLDR